MILPLEVSEPRKKLVQNLFKLWALHLQEWVASTCLEGCSQMLSSCQVVMNPPRWIFLWSDGITHTYTYFNMYIYIFIYIEIIPGILVCQSPPHYPPPNSLRKPLPTSLSFSAMTSMKAFYGPHDMKTTLRNNLVATCPLKRTIHTVRGIANCV